MKTIHCSSPYFSILATIFAFITSMQHFIHCHLFFKVLTSLFQRISSTAWLSQAPHSSWAIHSSFIYLFSKSILTVLFIWPNHLNVPLMCSSDHWFTFAFKHIPLEDIHSWPICFTLYISLCLQFNFMFLLTYWTLTCNLLCKLCRQKSSHTTDVYYLLLFH